MSVSSPKADLPAVLILGRKGDVGDRRQIQNERLCNEDKPLYAVRASIRLLGDQRFC